MKVKVYSKNKNVKISANYDGDNVLETARDFARNMSMFAPLTLETAKFKESWNQGKVIASDQTYFDDKNFGESDAVSFLAKHSGMTFQEICRGNYSGLKRAYLICSKKLHPDNRESGNHESFVKLQNAYQILQDTKKSK